MSAQACSSNRIDQFLEGKLSESDEAALTEHLDQCHACQQALESRVAKPDDWKQVRTCLASATPSAADHDATGAFDGCNTADLPLAVRQVLDQLAPTDQPKSLGRIDGFEILGVIGSGAMGVVLKAEDPPLERIVALKVMSPSLAVSGTARRRFAREAKAAAGVLHPNVIAIHGVSTDHDLPYLVMPYLKGISLRQRVDMQGPLSLVEILRIGSQIANGLAAAHQIGLIHRDIKPANVMLDHGIETAVITDFGLARTIDDATMTRSGAITGTPEYMSPEQARGDVIDPSSDLFSLGSVLYTLCTGRSPFRSQTALGVLRRITEESPPTIREINPDIPAWLCTLIAQLHQKSPSKRPTAVETHQTLERCLAHVHGPDRIALPPELADQTDTPNPLVSRPFQTGALLMLMLILGGALTVIFAMPTTPIVAPPSEDDKTQPMIATTKGKDVFKTLELDFPDPKKRGSVKIDINRGFIEVVGHDQPGVVIEVLKPSKKKAAKSDDDDGFVTQFSPSFDLDQDPQTNQVSLDTYNYSYTLNLRVKVPVQCDLSLDTYYDGYLKVENVSGRIDAHSQNSDITLARIAGSVSAYSYNGNLRIDLLSVDDDADLDIESYNGNIDLTIPADIKATTAVLTGRGSIKTMFEIGPLEMSKIIDPQMKTKAESAIKKGYQMGTINGGGIPIRIETEKGAVRIRKNSAARPLSL